MELLEPEFSTLPLPARNVNLEMAVSWRLRIPPNEMMELAHVGPVRAAVRFGEGKSK
jgi:hypothetical protein